MTSTIEAVRAEALFASPLQASERPSGDVVRLMVVLTERELGRKGCAELVAAEFGDHPETAVTRMRWALDTVHAVCPGPQRSSLPQAA
jgi:hypothetical protein